MRQQVAGSVVPVNPHEEVITAICRMNWPSLVEEELVSVAWAYYYFSIQFRECLEAARKLYPDDQSLLQLDEGERNTDNLSPWPGVAGPGERMNHDEFMRRALELADIPKNKRRELMAAGQAYLTEARRTDPNTKAMALASYEDGGLEKVFGAMLTARNWDGELLQAFKHFLIEHIRFDSDPEQGHGALCRHLTPDDRITPLWTGFKEMLLQVAPRLAIPPREGSRI